MADLTYVINRFFGLFFTDDTPEVIVDTTEPLDGVVTTPVTIPTPSPVPGVTTPLPGSTGGLPSNPVTTMTGNLEMRLGSMNVKNSLSKGQVVECGKLAAKQNAGVFGLQEIRQEMHPWIKEGFGPDWTDCHPNLQVPICVNTKLWTVVQSGNQLMHAGLANASPNRYVSWVRCKSKQNPGAPIIRFANTHMAVQKPNALKALEWRKQMWELHLNKMRGLLKDWEKELVFLTGDFNPDHKPVSLPNLKWVVQHDPDRIGVASPNQYKTAYVRGDTFQTPSDHNGITALFNLRSNL